METIPPGWFSLNPKLERRPEATGWLSIVIDVAIVGQMEFIQRARIEDLGVTQGVELGAASVLRRKTRHYLLLPNGVRIKMSSKK